MKKEILNHPAYGKIKISRTSIGGKGMRLFGSEIKHQTAIHLSISTTSLHRDLSKDWLRGGGNIVDIYLSPEQFATLLTSMNMGDGVCCTLNRVNGESVESIESLPNREQRFESELKNINNELLVRLKELSSKVGNLNLSKKKSSDVLNDIDTITKHLKSNYEFIADEFNVHMENTVTQSKAEIEAFISSAIHNAGLDGIKDKLNLLEEK